MRCCKCRDQEVSSSPMEQRFRLKNRAKAMLENLRDCCVAVLTENDEYLAAVLLARGVRQGELLASRNRKVVR